MKVVNNSGDQCGRRLRGGGGKVVKRAILPPHQGLSLGEDVSGFVSKDCGHNCEQRNCQSLDYGCQSCNNTHPKPLSIAVIQTNDISVRLYVVCTSVIDTM